METELIWLANLMLVTLFGWTMGYMAWFILVLLVVAYKMLREAKTP